MPHYITCTLTDIKAPNGCFWRLVLPAAVDKAATYNMLAGDKVLHIETFEELEEVCFLDSKIVGTVRALRARSESARTSLPSICTLRDAPLLSGRCNVIECRENRTPKHPASLYAC